MHWTTATTLTTTTNSDRNYKDGASIKFTKVSEDYTSLLGQKVKVMFKDGKTNNVLGVYAIADNTVYTTLMNGVEKDGDKIKFDGKSYSIDKKVALTFVGVNGVSTDTVAYTWFDKGTAHTEYTKTGVSITGNTSLSRFLSLIPMLMAKSIPLSYLRRLVAR